MMARALASILALGRNLPVGPKTIPTTRSGLGTRLALVAILLVAGAIRLLPLSYKDISFIDEGAQLQEARFFASLASGLLERAGVPLEWSADPPFDRVEGLGWPTRWGMLRGDPPLTQHPVHQILQGVAMLLAGERPFAAQLVSAVLGTATVGLVFRVVRLYSSVEAALLAAAALAVSGWHALYSTQGLAEVDALFFVALGVLLCQRTGQWTRRRPFLPALALGTAFATNPRHWILLPAFCLALALPFAETFAGEPLPALRGRLAALARWVRRCLWATAGFLAPAGLATVAYRLASVLVGRDLWEYSDVAASNIGYWLAYGAGSYELLPRPLIYLYLTWQWDGALLFSLAALGLALALWRRDALDGWVCLLFGLSSLYAACLTSAAARYFAFLALPAAILAGRVVAHLPPRLRGSASVLLLLVLLVEGVPRAGGLAGVSSGYRQAAAFVTERTGGKHLSNQPPNTGFYTGTANARWLSEDLDEVRRSVAEGYYLAVVALRPGLSAAAPWGNHPAAARLEPVARFPNPYGASLQNIMESHTTGLFERLALRSASSSREILVYDLRPLFQDPAPSG